MSKPKQKHSKKKLADDRPSSHDSGYDESNSSIGDPKSPEPKEKHHSKRHPREDNLLLSDQNLKPSSYRRSPTRRSNGYHNLYMAASDRHFSENQPDLAGSPGNAPTSINNSKNPFYQNKLKHHPGKAQKYAQPAQTSSFHTPYMDIPDLISSRVSRTERNSK